MAWKPFKGISGAVL